MLLLNKDNKNSILYRGRVLTWPLFFSWIFLVSCTHVFNNTNKKIIANDSIPAVENRDYIDHLKSLSVHYFKSPGTKVLKISRRNKNYLKSIVKKIIANNELLLPKADSIKITILKESAPLIFSLPGYQFFISNGLIKKYLKNESVLISALTYEIIKSGRNIYYKTLLVPTGHLSTPQIASVVRVKHKERLQLYRWSFIALKRSGYDATAILNWIQTINKNNVDFSWQFGNSRGIASDEFQFKNFLASQGLEVVSEKLINSSKGFYRLRDRL